ncbi:nSTAND1 domain-containing NTPase [Streptomyces poonensis]|uniref:HTH cro/C1-type domain-containing protein n=1 Tax=Streptomyces poonensis TaxID=68255 RepID=A0A918PCD2_9ACTN|nr:helix-turn-helix domain-containing protein [Streptomyces poonensis]GGY98925.1 hypothetical protein GCM10010365_17010 [Streptomyces poonensis]
MARQEKPLDPDAGPVQAFAWALRAVRQEAGQPTYRALAQKAGYSASTLSEAAAGERLPSLPVTLAYVTACGADPEEWEARWRTAAASAAALPAADDAEPPYRGLARYDIGDADLFFGRDQLIEDVLGLVRRERFTALFGPSGSGKSSLLRAGLLPALRHENTPELRPAALRILTPGARPARTHAAALVAQEDTAGDTVVVVDQFEEVFTLCTDPEERSRFLGRLLAARDPGSRLRVVVAVRADFLGRCAQHPELAAALRGTLLLVGPMDRDELRQAIVGPAQAAGLIVERSLTARLLAEVEGEPGGLPLMSHALLETWRRRQGRALTEAAYTAVGGLHGAIARTAENCYTGLTPEQAALARPLLLRLITPGDGTPDTRRPTPRTELDLGDVADAITVLERLTRARLITVDDGVVDLAHEALITAWPRLGGWLDAERARLRVHRQLTDAATTWQGLDRDPDALYRGTRLAVAEQAFPAAARRSELTSLEDEFLTAGVIARDREQRAAVRAARRQRRFTVIISVLLAVVLTAGVFAWMQYDTSETRGRRMADAAQAELSRKLAEEALELMGTEQELASLLALHAYRASRTDEAIVSLRAAAALPGRRHLVSGAAYVRLTFSSDGRTLITGDGSGRVRLWDVATAKTLRTLADTGEGRVYMELSRNGRTLAVAVRKDVVRLWDATTFKIRRTLPTDRWIEKLSPDGRTLATGGREGGIRLWDATTGELLHTLPAERTTGHTFSPDGGTLATTDDEKGVRLWDVTTGEALRTLPTKGTTYPSFSPTDGGTLVTTDEEAIRLWDADTGKVRRTMAGDDDVGSARAGQFSPDGRVLATFDRRLVRLWDATTGEASRTLPGEDTDIMAFSPDSRALATGDEDGRIALWDVATGEKRTTLADSGDITSLAFSPDGRTLAVGSQDDIRLWNTAPPTEPGEAIRTVCREVHRELTRQERSTYLPDKAPHHVCGTDGE